VFSVTVLATLLANPFEKWTIVCSRVYVLAGWRPFLTLLPPSNDHLKTRNEVEVMTDNPSGSPYWCRLPSRTHDQIFLCVLTIAGFFVWGALSDERMDL
jgi:hypothetical protein